jgi:hypothetical protein
MIMTTEQEKRFPKSIRKHIRLGKMRINQQFMSEEEKQKEVEALYKRFLQHDKKEPKAKA